MKRIALFLALVLAACSQATDTADSVKQIADIVQQVQSGVTSACATAGKVVPTAGTVLAVVEGLLGSQLNGSNIGQALALSQQAVDAISKVCQATGTPSTMSATSNVTTTVNGKNVELKFY